MKSPVLMEASPLVEVIYRDLRARAEVFHKRAKRPPKLSVVIVGTNPASQIYVSRKEKAAKEVGFAHETVTLPETVSVEDLRAKIDMLNRNGSIDGVLIQTPLPGALASQDLSRWVMPAKDVDCFHPENAGLLFLGRPKVSPCTPSGIIRLLDHYKIEIAGKRACVIGRSTIVGKPMAALLLARDATVFHCHSKTKDLKEITLTSDIVVTAAGQKQFLDASFFKKDAVIVDVGIHRLPDGKIVGDLDFDSVSKVASALTPVPGGVGPMTIAMLLENTMKLAESHK